MVSERCSPFRVLVLYGTNLFFTVPPIVHPLVCVLGEYTDIINRIPPDDVCDYLFYDHVVLQGNTIVAANKPNTFLVFLQAVGSYTKTAFGLSFNARYVK